MKKTLKEKENLVMLFLSIIMNVAAFILVIYVIHPVFESNDDVTMAMLAENTEGATKGILLFSNIIYTKLLQVLYSVTRAIKWYVWIQLGGIFVSLTSVTYMLYRKLGYFFGTLINILLTSFLTFNTYYKFQFTRTAGICAAAGILLVFFALEKKKCVSKYLQLLVAFCLIFYASLVRFDSLATAAIGLSVVGIVKVIELFKEKNIKRVLEYVLVFVIVFAVPLGGYVYNNHYYNSGELQYYTQYNKLRSELFDLGFPSYSKNKELYKSMGISKKDLEYFQTWNSDSDVLTLENMQKLVDAKESKITGPRSVARIVKNALIAVYSNDFFAFYVAVCFVTVFINRKRGWLVSLQVLMLFLTELYLTYIGRTGLARVDFSIYVGMIISQLYYLDVRKFKIKWPNKEAVLRATAISVAALAIGISPLDSLKVPTFSTFYINYSANLESAKSTRRARAFFNMLGEHKDTLFVTAIDNSVYSTGTSVPFFYVCDENCNDNIYCLGGWNKVLPVSEQKIAKFDINNIYEDSINNQNVLFVLGDSVGNVEDYINRNYNKTVKFYVVKYIDGQPIYTLKNSEVYMTRKMLKKADESIVKNVKVKVKTKYSAIKISGYAYKKDTDSLEQRAYALLTDKNGFSQVYELTLANLNGHNDVKNGKYSNIVTELGIENPDQYKIDIVIGVNGDFYKVN